jgi:hypothetical protein
VKTALDLVKKTATAKFDESVDVAVNLGIDAKKSGPGRARLGRPSARHGQDRARRRIHPGRERRGGARRLARTSSASTTSPRRSRAASWTSTS